MSIALRWTQLERNKQNKKNHIKASIKQYINCKIIIEVCYNLYQYRNGSDTSKSKHSVVIYHKEKLKLIKDKIVNMSSIKSF